MSLFFLRELCAAIGQINFPTKHTKHTKALSCRFYFIGVLRVFRGQTFLHEPSALSAVKSLIAVEALRVVVVNQSAVNIVSIVLRGDLRVNVSTPG